jgi:cyclophilin family peptidyl-prolyl cis-trans isomerase
MNWRTTFSIHLSWILAITLIGFVGCGGGEENAQAPAEPQPAANAPAETAPRVTPTANAEESSPFKMTPKMEIANPQIIFRTSLGEITVELDAKKAPVTVDNFLANYVERGFYNDTIFHYVEPNMIVGGGYSTDNTLKETRAEIHSEANNKVSNKRGTLAMARAPDFAHSATSQFFFNVTDNTQFDHQSMESAQTYGYCVFGKVTGGMAVLDKIAAVATSEAEISPKFPTEPVVINSIEVIKQ